MGTRLSSKSLDKITEREYYQCRALNHGDGGSMRAVLDYYALEVLDHLRGPRYFDVQYHRDRKWNYFGSPEDTYIYMIHDIESSKLLSWAIVFSSCNKISRRMRWHAFFYTRYTARRNGYGKRLLKRITSEFEAPIRFYPHDHKSKEFFKSLHKRVERP